MSNDSEQDKATEELLVPEAHDKSFGQHTPSVLMITTTNSFKLSQIGQAESQLT